MNTNTALITNGDIELYAENIKDCLKSESNITGATHYNVCTGTQSFVPYGTYDHITSVSIIIFIALVLIGMAGVVYHIFND